MYLVTHCVRNTMTIIVQQAVWSTTEMSHNNKLHGIKAKIKFYGVIHSLAVNRLVSLHSICVCLFFYFVFFVDSERHNLMLNSDYISNTHRVHFLRQSFSLCFLLLWAFLWRRFIFHSHKRARVYVMCCRFLPSLFAVVFSGRSFFFLFHFVVAISQLFANFCCCCCC